MRWVVGHLCVVPGGGLRIEVGLEEDALDALEIDDERLSNRSWYAKTPEDREPVEEIESERSMASAVIVTIGRLLRAVEDGAETDQHMSAGSGRFQVGSVDYVAHHRQFL